MTDHITIDEVEHVILCSLDLGQRNIQDTYVDPLIRLSFEMRMRAPSPEARDTLLRLAEEDLATLREDDDPYWLETASSILEAWEQRASDYGLIGYAEEGMYWIAAQS
jgi:hypothetical protein